MGLDAFPNTLWDEDQAGAVTMPAPAQLTAALAQANTNKLVVGASSIPAPAGSFPAATAATVNPTPNLQANPIPDSWKPHPMDPLRFVKHEIRQLLLSRGSLSIAQLPEEYLKCYRKPLTQALKMLDSQYTPESARSGKPSGRARKSTLGAFLREHLTDIIEVRQRPHGQHEIVATGAPNTNGAGMHNNAGMHTNVTGVQQVANDQYGAFRAGLQQQTWAHQETPEEHIRALILKQQQQQQLQQQQHLRQLRNALSQATVGAPGGIPAYDSPLSFDVNGPLMGSQQVREVLMSAQGAALPSLLKGAGYNVDGANLPGLDSFGADVNASLLAMSRPGAGSDALAAAAVGALRGAALLSPAASEIPAENRIYVTWRVPSKAIPLRVEDLWSYFSRFGQLAFCNPRPLRNSHAPRRTPSLSGAGYAFLGFSNPGGAEAVARVLERPSHALRGAEIRVKPWRERDEDTGSGDAPAAAVAADVPHAVGDYYFPHPESGLPVLASAAGLARLATVSNSAANSQALAMNDMASLGFGLSSNISHRSASDVALDSLGFDETALFGEGFFNIGPDDSSTRAKLGNGPAASAQYMSYQNQLNAARNGGMWGGSGNRMWGGSSGSERSERSSLESPNASADQASDVTFHPSTWQSSTVETPVASDETWTGSRLWNYTGGTTSTGSGA